MHNALSPGAPPEELGGTMQRDVLRSVVVSKAGWLRWYDQLPNTLIKPGRTPIALRVALSDGSGFDLTEAGTKKSLAVYVVREPADVMLAEVVATLHFEDDQLVAVPPRAQGRSFLGALSLPGQRRMSELSAGLTSAR